MPAVRVFDDVRHDLEAVLVKQGAVLGSVQAPVVKRFALECADCLPMFSTAREHQGCLRTGMQVEDRKHRALVLWGQVKEAIPRQNAIKTTIQWYKDHQDWWRSIKSGEYLKYYQRQYGRLAS